VNGVEDINGKLKVPEGVWKIPFEFLFQSMLMSHIMAAGMYQ